MTAESTKSPLVEVVSRHLPRVRLATLANNHHGCATIVHQSCQNSRLPVMSLSDASSTCGQKIGVDEIVSTSSRDSVLAAQELFPRPGLITHSQVGFEVLPCVRQAKQ